MAAGSDRGDFKRPDASVHQAEDEPARGEVASAAHCNRGFDNGLLEFPPLEEQHLMRLE
jgi:hypothetical protein